MERERINATVGSSEACDERLTAKVDALVRG